MNTGGLRRIAAIAYLGLMIPGCALLGPHTGDEKVEQRIGTCDPAPCIRVAIDPVPTLPEGLSPELKALITTDVRGVLFAPLEADEAQQDDDVLMKELKARYEEFAYGGFSDVPIEWELTRTATVLYQNPDVISIDIHNEGYVGGAHGFADRTLFTYDVKRGKRLAIADLVDPNSEGIFHRVVEAQFRRAREVPANESLSQAGYFVTPGEPILVPENFAITPGGLVLQYNPYEIAPWSYGPTEIVVPLEAFEGVLKSDVKSLTATINEGAKKA